MLGEILLYVGAGVTTAWGLAHIPPTRSVVAGFGPVPEDNRRIVTMGWVTEGLTLCFLGLLVLLVTMVAGPKDEVSIVVYGASTVMLSLMAGLSMLTGARTSILAMKLCPLVKLAAAYLILMGTIL